MIFHYKMYNESGSSNLKSWWQWSLGMKIKFLLVKITNGNRLNWLILIFSLCYNHLRDWNPRTSYFFQFTLLSSQPILSKQRATTIHNDPILFKDFLSNNLWTPSLDYKINQLNTAFNQFEPSSVLNFVVLL